MSQNIDSSETTFTSQQSSSKFSFNITPTEKKNETKHDYFQ